MKGYGTGPRRSAHKLFFHVELTAMSSSLLIELAEMRDRPLASINGSGLSLGIGISAIEALGASLFRLDEISSPRLRAYQGLEGRLVAL
jgi:hypothetical protein